MKLATLAADMQSNCLVDDAEDREEASQSLKIVFTTMFNLCFLREYWMVSKAVSHNPAYTELVADLVGYHSCEKHHAPHWLLQA
jgi:hypothetical protein